MTRWRIPMLCAAGVVVLLFTGSDGQRPVTPPASTTSSTPDRLIDEPYEVTASLDGATTTCTIREEVRDDGVLVIRFIECERAGG